MLKVSDDFLIFHFSNLIHFLSFSHIFLSKMVGTVPCACPFVHYILLARQSGQAQGTVPTISPQRMESQKAPRVRFLSVHAALFVGAGEA